MARRDELADGPLGLKPRTAEDLGGETVEERAALAEQHVGESLGGWRLLRVLGVGPVTAAYQVVRGEKDAKEQAVLRLMIGRASRDEVARGLFMRASYAANRFKHSRVVLVNADGVDQAGARFVVRPWLDLTSLSATVGRSVLKEPEALRAAEQLLDIVEIAHANGVLHGAIHPGNVMLTPRQSIRLVDFATAPGLSGARTDEDVLAPLRVDGYSSPERAYSPGLAASEASDIYAIGACLYFATTGQTPAEHRTAKDGAPAIAATLARLEPTLTEDFCKVIAHSLAFDAAQRYESAYAFLGDVRRVMAGRRPKLEGAAAPVPSTSVQDLSRQAPSSRRISFGPPARKSDHTGLRAKDAPPNEWKGNLFLIVAIALLLGIATFVVFREKTLDQRQRANESSGK
jgi:serine/threonine-protein kinase